MPQLEPLTAGAPGLGRLVHREDAPVVDAAGQLFSDDLNDVAMRLHPAAIARGVSKMCPAGPETPQRPLPDDRERGRDLR